MSIFEEVKTNVSTPQAAERLGLHLVKKGSRWWVNCPNLNHRDKNPSCCLYPSNGFKCFSCGVGGSDSISFIAIAKGIPQFEAAKFLAHEFGIAHDEERLQHKSQPPPRNIEREFIQGLERWRIFELNRLVNMKWNILKILETYKNPQDQDEAFYLLVEILAEAEWNTDILASGDLKDIHRLKKYLEGTTDEAIGS